MKINDIVYGEATITEPVLLELIQSPAVNRLKKIQQYGFPNNMYHLPGFSRYEHSLGVLLLLKLLGASLTEQIAGLLHDVSHTAFSHVVDWAIGDPTKEDYQDNNHKQILAAGTIPSILERHGFRVAEISELSAHPLLEREAPDLCADRVDYTLRELAHQGKYDVIATCIKALRVHDNTIIFADYESAAGFAWAYYNCQKYHWGADEARFRFYLLSQALKEALQQQIITLDDLWLDDEAVFEKLSASDNRLIQRHLATLADKRLFATALGQNKTPLVKKQRYVDPQYISNQKVVRLSDTDSQYALALSKL